MSQPEKPSVPKFKSFKPKSKSSAPAPSHSRDGQREPSPSSYKRRRLDDGSNRRPHKHRDNGTLESTVSTKRSIPGPLTAKSRPTIESPDDKSELFFVDRRGDAKNVEYGSIHRYDVPAYHRSGFGMLIGAPREIRIDREQSTSTAAVLQTRRRPHERLDRWLTSNKSCISDRELRVVPKSAQAATWDLESDEIALRAAAPEQDVREFDQMEHDTVDYRSIEGKAHPATDSKDVDLESVSESEEIGAGPLAELARQENIRLTQRVKDAPSDLESWLSLAKHQVGALYPGEDPTNLTTSQGLALADARAAVYQRALKHFRSGTKEHEMLVLRLLDDGQSIWEPTKIMSKWKEALSTYPRSLPICRHYLNFVQSGPTTSTFEKCKAEYLNCFATFASAVNPDTAPSHTDRVYLVLRFATLVRDAGYTEMAIAIWQILLERHFFRSEDGSLESLESFWEADVPRIGEDGALGWAHYHNHGSRMTRTATHDDSQTNVKVRDTADFAREEIRLQQVDFLPACTVEDAHDPFRFVMFSDLRPVLDFITVLIPGGLIINAFLTFLGLPMLPTHPSECSEWQTDSYLIAPTAPFMEKNGHDVPQHGLTCHLQSRPSSLQWLFESAFVAFSAATGQDVNVVRFADRALDMLCAAQPGMRDLSQYSIAYKLRFLPKEVVKAKKLLKAQPHNSALYNAYALAEAVLGNVDKARQVWSLITQSAKSVINEQDKLLLYHSWILTEIDRRQDDEALKVIRSLCSIKRSEDEGTAETAVEKLKVVQVLQHGWANTVERTQYQHAVRYAECHALYSYLSDDQELGKVLATFRKRSHALSSRGASKETELLHEAKVRLIRAHLDRQRSHKPALLQGELEESIRMFPNNTFFLQTYAESEARFDLVDRIRAPLRSQLLGSGSRSLVGISFSIDQEIQRYSSGFGNSSRNAVRNAFSKALLTPGSPARYCSSLWSRWLRFECSSASGMGDDFQQKAKQVFFDGLRYLPWSKGWVVRGLLFDWDNQVMSHGELAHVRKTLDERELRVRTEPL